MQQQLWVISNTKRRTIPLASSKDLEDSLRFFEVASESGDLQCDRANASAAEETSGETGVLLSILTFRQQLKHVSGCSQ